MPPARSTAVTVTLLCVAEVLAMTAFSTYASVLPTLQQAWRMTNAESGCVSGALFAGYMLAVPGLSALTDAVAPRKVYVCSCVVLAAGAASFGVLADGPARGAACHVLTGAGLAGTYMPGLRMLSDHIDMAVKGRAIAFYTSCFGVGASVSVILAGAVAASHGWRASFLAAAAGPLAALLIVAWALPPRIATPGGGRVDITSVFRDRAALAYTLGYAAHCFELFAFRSWIVAFLTLASGAEQMRAGSIAALLNLLGPPASIVGNEMAAASRLRFIRSVMMSSALLAVVTGLAAGWPLPAAAAVSALYFLAVMADSSALTTGLMAATRVPPGAALGIYSFAGFAAAALAPVVFGAALDIGGGAAERGAWRLAFAVLGGASVVGWLALGRQTEAARSGLPPIPSPAGGGASA